MTGERLRRVSFVPDQFVIGTIEKAALIDELAYVVRPLFEGMYEVVFLKDHEVTSSLDPIRVLHPSKMRPASVDEVIAKKRAWEGSNNHTLPFSIHEGRGRVLIRS